MKKRIFYTVAIIPAILFLLSGCAYYTQLFKSEELAEPWKKQLKKTVKLIADKKESKSMAERKILFSQLDDLQSGQYEAKWKCCRNLAAAWRRAGFINHEETEWISLLQTVRKKHGPKHPETAQAEYELGMFYMFSGQYILALEFLEPSLDVLDATYWKNNPHYRDNRYVLSNLYYKLARYEDVLRVDRRMLPEMRKFYGEDMPTMSLYDMNSALVSLARGMYTQAEKEGRAILLRTRHVLGENCPETAHVMIQLADILNDANKNEEAIILLESAKKILNRKITYRSPLLIFMFKSSVKSFKADAATLKARVYRDMKQYDKAEKAFRRACKLHEKLSKKKDDTDTAMALADLGYFLGRRNRFAEGSALLDRAIAMLKRIRGNTHPMISTVLYKKARMFQAQFKHTLAIEMFQSVISIRERAYGPVHPGLLRPLHWMEESARALGNQALVEKLQARIDSLVFELKRPPYEIMKFKYET